MTEIKKTFTGKKPAPRICIFGHFGSTNFGNEITFQTILIQLGARFPEAEVICICTGPETLIAAQKIETVPMSRKLIGPWKPQTRMALLLKRIFFDVPCELIRWFDPIITLAKTDVLIIPGTGILTDAWGVFGLSAHAWGPYNSFKWSLMAKLCGCKLMFVSVGVGPLYSSLGKYLVKSTLSMADFRSYRDDASKRCLQRIGFPTMNDRVYPDLVFGFPEAMLPNDSNKNKRRTIVGLGLMSYPGKYSVATPTHLSYQEYLRTLVAFARWLLAHDYDIRLIIGDLQDKVAVDEFKVLLTKTLGQYDERRLIDEPALSVEQVLPQIAATDLVVATRFHNVLLALVLNKPVISISFHHKCASLMSQMGLAEYCHDINDMNAARLIGQFQHVEKNTKQLKAIIRQRVEEARRALDEQSDVIFNGI